MSFALDVSKFVEKTKRNNETVMRSVAFKLFSAIIKASPVDTGRFRMNWQTAGATPRSGLVAGEDKTGAAAIASAETFITNTQAWEEFTLANNLPYANVIEFGGYPGSGPNTVGGYSKQAPQGVVRINVVRFQQLIDEEAAKVR
jgi:hypothetical protein